MHVAQECEFKHTKNVDIDGATFPLMILVNEVKSHRIWTVVLLVLADTGNSPRRIRSAKMSKTIEERGTGGGGVMVTVSQFLLASVAYHLQK